MPPKSLRRVLALTAAAWCAFGAAALATPPDGFEEVDLIADPGFETDDGGFGGVTPADGSVTLSRERPISGTQSLHVKVNGFGRVLRFFDYGFDAGAFADSVTAVAKVRVDAATAPGRSLQVCAIAYLQHDPEPHSTCVSYPVDADHVVDVSLPLDTGRNGLDAALFQFKLNDSGTLEATVDDAHLLVVQRHGSPSPDTPPVPVPAGDEAVDLLTDNGFESGAGTHFAPISAYDGSVAVTAEQPLAGAHSLAISTHSYGRVVAGHDYPYEGGPRAESLTALAKLRVDEGGDVEVCAVAYFEHDGEPHRSCGTHPTADGVVDVSQRLETAGAQLDRVFFQVKRGDDGTVRSTLDDTHLYVVQPLPPVANPGPAADSLPTGPATDVIEDGTFDESAGGFAPAGAADGTAERSAIAPIAGASSLAVHLSAYGRVAHHHAFAYGEGPAARALVARAKLRVDAGAKPGARVEACAIAYVAGEPEPRRRCASFPVTGRAVDLGLTLQTGGKQLERVLFQLALDGEGSIDAALDDAQLLVFGA